MAKKHVDEPDAKQEFASIQIGGTAFQRAYSGHGAIMYVVDLASFQIVDANEAALNFYGFSREVLLEKRVPDLNMTPEPEIRAEIKRAVSEGRSYYMFKHQLASGDIRDVEIYANPISIDGKDYSFSIVHDITERLRAEEALKASESRYRALFTNEIYAICVFEINSGTILEANDAWMRFYGYQKEELTFLSIKDILADPLSSKGYVAESGRVSQGLIRKDRHVRKDGSEVVVEFSALSFQWKNRELMHLLIRDITKQTEAEEKLVESQSLLAETQKIAHLGSWEYDVQTERIKWSEETFRIAGMKPVDSLPVQVYLDTLHPDDLPMLQTAMERAVTEKAPYELELRHKRPDGTYNTTQTRGKPVFLNGELVKFIGSVQDVTEIKKQAAERLKLENQLQQSRKMESIATLAGGIAHQFNNALTGIMGNIELLEMEIQDQDTATQYMEGVKQSSARMVKLAQQLLAYARGGKYKDELVSGDILIRDTLPLIKHSVHSAVHIDTDIPLGINRIRVDVTQMQLVFSSILANASEAIAKQGRIKVRCRNKILAIDAMEASAELKPGSYVCFCFEDDGAGMDDETRRRIFEPFFTTKFTGRGLGMAAAYGIVKNHGGVIKVESKAGAGTTVSVFLPVAEPANLGSVSSVEPAKRSGEKGSGTVLVIEDEKIVLDIIVAQLETLGYRVLKAMTGKEAVSIAESFDGEINLAILDMILPDMKGLEIYQGITKARTNLKVIVCSGYAIDGPAKEVMANGAEDFVQKPFLMAELSKKLKILLG